MKVLPQDIQRAFTEVFAHTSYIALAGTLAITAFLFAVWLPNTRLIADIFITSGASFATKLKVAVALLGGIGTNFSFLSAGYTIAIAALFGVNTAMIVYLLKRVRAGLGSGPLVAGVGSITSGALGIGCAACGSFILTAALSSLGAASVLAMLPLRGGEFGILSVALLVLSLILISRKIAAPRICTATP